MSPKTMTWTAMGAAIIIAVVSVLDLALGIPYNRAVIMDVLFLLSSAAVIYFSIETNQEHS